MHSFKPRCLGKLIVGSKDVPCVCTAHTGKEAKKR